jgi:uncharacterized protein YtpQ (UPF0354 family)
MPGESKRHAAQPTDSDHHDQRATGITRSVYGLDRDHGIEFLDGDSLRRLGRSILGLREASLRNLRSVLGNGVDVRRHPSGVNMILAGGNYEASMLVADKFWDQWEKSLGEPILAAAPARDVVVFCRESDPAAVAELRSTVERVSSTGDHLISRTVLRRVGGHWELAR